ncbi:phosphoesterase, partial [Streptomyces sp. NPDC002922]
MRETPRSQGTAGDTGSEHPQHRPGRAIAHTTGASGSGTPHRSDGRSPQTPRGARQTDHGGRP